jgi:hypothetical protein
MRSNSINIDKRIPVGYNGDVVIVVCAINLGKLGRTLKDNGYTYDSMDQGVHGLFDVSGSIWYKIVPLSAVDAEVDALSGVINNFLVRIIITTAALFE